MCYNEMDKNVYEKRVEWDVYGRPTGHLWRRRGVPHSGGGTLLPVYKIYQMGEETVHALDGISLTVDPGEFEDTRSLLIPHM